MAVLLTIWIGYVAFDELRGYIRMRQAYLTSPQHRLKASATTVLVSSIPRKWMTIDALDGLYDVFPGGIRNIWLNRNYDPLSEKIQERNKIAENLEAAETDLIRNCFKKHEEKLEKERKQAGKKLSKQEKEHADAVKDQAGGRDAVSDGLTSNDPHQTQHTVKGAVAELDGDASISSSVSRKTSEDNQRRPLGLQAVTKGLDKLNNTIFGGLRRGMNGVIDNPNGFHATSLRVDSRADHTYDSADDHALPPTPHMTEYHATGAAMRPENDSQHLTQPTPTTPKASGRFPEDDHRPQKTLWDKVMGVFKSGDDDEIGYPKAFKDGFDEDPEDAMWRKYFDIKDRDTTRMPIFGWSWMISLPLVGQKVDTIYHYRKELARLNLEIEEDQAHPERFPLLDSAFIQFNHQVAAHMACQSVSHHTPKHMAPRLVEIDPNDVIWDNMSTPWYMAYIRTAGVVGVVAVLIVLWAFPVAFTSFLSNINTLANTYKWLHWLLKLPGWLLNTLQGVLPAAFLGLLMFLLPVTLRFLCRVQGLQSGMLIELSVQKYYFAFLFVQIFLVVSIANAATQIVSYFKNVSNVANLPQLFAQNIPAAANYFFSYILLQALSVSGGALVQVGGLLSWFVFAPILDSTARSKFRRQTSLSEIQWGTFFPVYTNLACIGIIYSVIAPLILLFNVIMFALFWFVYRYNTLYVTKFTRDTGGLLFPTAVYYTFTGVYIMHICLIGLFFIVEDAQGKSSGKGQAIGMIVVLILMVAYHYLLNEAFSPLFRYLPITLEDDAVRRDQEFARALNKRDQGLLGNEEHEDDNLQDELERRERQSREEDREAEEYELGEIEHERDDRRTEQHTDSSLSDYQIQNPHITMDMVDEDSRGVRIAKSALAKTTDAANRVIPTRVKSVRRPTHWADRDQNRRSRHFGGGDESSRSRSRSHHAGHQRQRSSDTTTITTTDPSTSTSTRPRAKSTTAGIPNPAALLDHLDKLNPLAASADLEAQAAARTKLTTAIFANIHDELEDLSAEQRDTLVQRAFQHSATRARRPVIWLPRDQLCVSDDEVLRLGACSQFIWASNVRQGLDSKGRTVYSGAPPDFSEVELIAL